jgi:hypothetical protein
MTHGRALALSVLTAASLVAGAQPTQAQACSHDGPVVNCDDGRRGLLSGDAIIWADGTRSSGSPHPSVIIGNKSSVHVGPGVFVGKATGWSRWTIPTRRTRRAAPFWMAFLIATSF